MNLLSLFTGRSIEGNGIAGEDESGGEDDVGPADSGNVTVDAKELILVNAGAGDDGADDGAISGPRAELEEAGELPSPPHMELSPKTDANAGLRRAAVSTPVIQSPLSSLVTDGTSESC